MDGLDFERELDALIAKVGTASESEKSCPVLSALLGAIQKIMRENKINIPCMSGNNHDEECFCNYCIKELETARNGNINAWAITSSGYGDRSYPSLGEKLRKKLEMKALAEKTERV